MAQISILKRKCDGCARCVEGCPFGAIALQDGIAEIDAGCRVCGICLKACPNQAIIRLETKRDSVDKSAWQGVLVFAEMSADQLHPISLELIGEARKLAEPLHQAVSAVLLGGGETEACARELQHYGLERVYVYEDEALSFFRAETYAVCIQDAIEQMKPSVVLVGATALGRSLAPRLSTRLRTGLTADCTQLALREDGDLVQIRPAFGGNIMAQIVTPHTRPQFATVRYKVMQAPARNASPSGQIIHRETPAEVFQSPVRLISSAPVPPAASISDAEVLVVAGRGLQKEADLQMIKELAALLGGEYAVTRPLAEKGWASNLRQIGLSGRTVRPKLIITCGVSGAIQFTACMDASERIVAINCDAEAPIFQVAHIGIVGDLYEIIPELLERLRKEDAHEAI